MRIIGGQYGGRRITPPAQMPHTRPTTDIAKEGLFNILQNTFDFEESSTLDLFGGTGCISYELASRGCVHQIIVEQDPKMAAFIQKTADQLGLSHLQLVRSDVFRFIRQCQIQFDFIFAGPPYALKEIDLLPELIFQHKLLRPNGLFVLEHTPRNDYSTHPQTERVKNYGTTVFTFFREGEATT